MEVENGLGLWNWAFALKLWWVCTLAIYIWEQYMLKEVKAFYFKFRCFIENSIVKIWRRSWRTCKSNYFPLWKLWGTNYDRLKKYRRKKGILFLYSLGGGQLAHTILGIDYNVRSGESRFLVLDPHYTGGENIDIIVKKGWCGWKPITFWDKKSFYNLLLPINPKVDLWAILRYRFFFVIT